MPPDPRRYQGEIVEWNEQKRCGFIRPRGSKSTDPIVFLPASEIGRRDRTPGVGIQVTYEVHTLGDTPENRRLRTRLRAQRVSFADEAPREPPVADLSRAFCVLGFAYIVSEAVALFFVPAFSWSIFYTLILSLISIGQYGWDKRAAEEKRWRVSEQALHTVALLGGWPGAAVGQAIFRHKTRKRSFQTAFRLAVLLNVVGTIGAFAYFAGWIK